MLLSNLQVVSKTIKYDYFNAEADSTYHMHNRIRNHHMGHKAVEL